MFNRNQQGRKTTSSEQQGRERKVSKQQGRKQHGRKRCQLLSASAWVSLSGSPPSRRLAMASSSVAWAVCWRPSCTIWSGRGFMAKSSLSAILHKLNTTALYLLHKTLRSLVLYADIEDSPLPHSNLPYHINEATCLVTVAAEWGLRRPSLYLVLVTLTSTILPCIPPFVLYLFRVVVCPRTFSLPPYPPALTVLIVCGLILPCLTIPYLRPRY